MNFKMPINLHIIGNLFFFFAFLNASLIFVKYNYLNNVCIKISIIVRVVKGEKKPDLTPKINKVFVGGKYNFQEFS